MQSSQRTALGAYLQTNQLLGLPVNILPNTTLNEKLSINASEALATGELPAVRYIAIGNGGHKMVVGANNLSKPEPILHTPQHESLYNQLPFVLRTPDNDLTADERANYRLRKIITVNSVTYVAYYLKLLDLSTTNPQLELRTVSNGITTTSIYNPSINDLNPTPPPLTPGQSLSTTGDYLSATAKVPFIMSSSDIAEFLEVANILYGDVNYAIISEIALCSGFDRSVPGDFNGSTVNYIDVIATQVTNFISAFFATAFSNNGIDVTFDIGSNEPLLVIQ